MESECTSLVQINDSLPTRTLLLSHLEQCTWHAIPQAWIRVKQQGPVVLVIGPMMGFEVELEERPL